MNLYVAGCSVYKLNNQQVVLFTSSTISRLFCLQAQQSPGCSVYKLNNHQVVLFTSSTITRLFCLKAQQSGRIVYQPHKPPITLSHSLCNAFCILHTAQTTDPTLLLPNGSNLVNHRWLIARHRLFQSPLVDLDRRSLISIAVH